MDNINDQAYDFNLSDNFDDKINLVDPSPWRGLCVL